LRHQQQLQEQEQREQGTIELQSEERQVEATTGGAPTQDSAQASLPPASASSTLDVDTTAPASREEAAEDRPFLMDPGVSGHSWHFPSLYRVVREGGTAVWDPDGGGESEEGGGTGCVSRVLSLGTVVLCTSVSLDDRAKLFLQVPGGWIPEDDVVHVMDVRG
jgi:hypothetical protein